MEISINRRGKDRYTTDIAAQYFIKKQSDRYENCIIVNMSRTGAAVRFPRRETITKGAEVFIEVILPQGFEQFTLKGVIKRVQEKEAIGGIHFCEMLDEFIFEKLVAK